jgi:hypothetical protein
MSSLRRTISAASSGAPISLFSKYRYSVTMSLLLSSQARAAPAKLPRSGRPHRYPIQGTFFGCCASAMTRNSKQHHCNQDCWRRSRLHCAPHSCGFLSRIRKLRKLLFRRNGKPDSSRGKAKFGRRIELNDATVGSHERLARRKFLNGTTLPKPAPDLSVILCNLFRFRRFRWG